MSNVLGVAVSGLVSLQQAISTTGNNVVNVNTEGYSRQTVDLVTQPSTLTGAGFVGNGVKTAGIRRIYDQFLVDQVREYSASSATLGTQAELSSRLDNLLADPAAGLTENLQKFFGSLQNVANNPASLPERQVALSEGRALVNQARFLDSSLSRLNDEINSRMKSAVKEINVLATNIAKANARITSVGGGNNGQLPNDLLDLRDRLLADLSTKVSIRTLDQGDGGINVLVGSGQPLVVGAQTTELTVLANTYDGSRMEVGFVNNGANPTQITSLIKGGELQGLTGFRDQVLDPARRELGLLILGLSESFNARHRMGLDSQGNPGTDFFSPVSPAVLANGNNAGSAVPTVSVTDVSRVETSDYLLRYDGTDWQVLRLSDNDSTTGTPPFLSLDGLDISISGSAVAGDSFLIRPTFEAPSKFAVALSEPYQLAAAGAVRGENSVLNAGDGRITQLVTGAESGLPLAGAVTLTFDPDALGAGIPGFNVTGGPTGPLAYDPATDGSGKEFVLAGYGDVSFTMSGIPAAGDQFVIENNTSGAGDNRNAILLSQLQTTKILETGQSTYQDVYGNMVASIAVKSRENEVNLKTENTLLNQATIARDGVSGVNLDEEAANLLKFQQAYQAAAQMVAVAQDLFQTLINATR